MNAGVRADAARWARAFPRRWRERHLEALLDTVEEMSGGSDRLDRRAALDLVLAGWGERLRTHPPLGSWLAYCLLERRLDPRWHPWILDDLRGPWLWLRVWLRRAVPMWAVYSGIWVAFRLTGSSQGFPWAFLLGPVLALPIVPATVRRHRRRTLDRQGLAADGTWAAPVTWGRPWVPEVQASHPVAGGATLLGATTAVVGLALLWGAAYPRATTSGPFGSIPTDGNSPIGRVAVVVIAVAAAALGALVAPLVARRVRRRPTRPDRPALTPRQHRHRRLSGAALVLAGAGYTWAGVVSLLPDAASAVAGGGLVTAGSALAGLAWGARRRGAGGAPFTWSDLMTSRSRYAVPVHAPAAPA